MARSGYIYVVTKKGEIVAGFTVKHELTSWLDNNSNDDMIVTSIRAIDQKTTDITSQL